MTSPSRSWHARADQADLPNPLHGLIELLLDLLLNDVPASKSAQLTIQPKPELEPENLGTATTPPYLHRGDQEPAGRRVTASAPQANGEVVTLAVWGELVDDEPTQARLRRFIRPMVACADLERQLDQHTGQARDALAEIERRAITDLATGIVMARRDCDPPTARARLAAWSERTGVDLQALSAVRILELLTADQP